MVVTPAEEQGNTVMTSRLTARDVSLRCQPAGGDRGWRGWVQVRPVVEVIQREASSWNNEPAAVAAAERVSASERVALAVDHVKVRR